MWELERSTRHTAHPAHCPLQKERSSALESDRSDLEPQYLPLPS